MLFTFAATLVEPFPTALRLAHVQYSRLPLLDNKLLEQFLSTAIIEGRLAFLHGWLACSLDESRQNNFVGQLTWMSSRS